MSPERKLKELMKEIVPNLPNDVCRCHDLTGLCGRNDTCRRFLQRNTGGVNVRHGNMLQLDSLGECIKFISVDDDQQTRLI